MIRELSLDILNFFFSKWHNSDHAFWDCDYSTIFGRDFLLFAQILYIVAYPVTKIFRFHFNGAFDVSNNRYSVRFESYFRPWVSD